MVMETGENIQWFEVEKVMVVLTLVGKWYMFSAETSTHYLPKGMFVYPEDSAEEREIVLFFVPWYSTFSMAEKKKKNELIFHNREILVSCGKGCNVGFFSPSEMGFHLVWDPPVTQTNPKKYANKQEEREIPRKNVFFPHPSRCLAFFFGFFPL